MPVSNRRKRQYKNNLSDLLGDARQDLEGLSSQIQSDGFDQNNQSTGELLTQAQNQAQSIQQSFADGSMFDNQSGDTSTQDNQQSQQTQPQSQDTPSSEFQGDLSGQEVAEAGASYDQFQNIAESQSDLTQEERRQIRRDLGVEEAQADAFYIPEQETQEVFEQAYENSELGEVKARIQKVQDEINEQRNNLADAINQINDNPFLSEDTRVGRGEKRMRQAERRINNKQQRVKQLESIYDRGITEVRNMLARRDQDIARRNKIGRRKMNYLSELANKRAERIKQDRLADVESEESVPFLMEQQEREEPETFGSASTGYYRWNPDTKQYELVASQEGGGGGGQASSGGGSFARGNRSDGQTDPAADNRSEPYTLDDGSTVPATFEQWVESLGVKPENEVASTVIDEEEQRLRQNLTPASRKEVLKQSPRAKEEYNRLVNNAVDNVSSNPNQTSLDFDNLSPNDIEELQSAGLQDAPSTVQSFFLGSDSDFRDWVIRAANVGYRRPDGSYKTIDISNVSRQTMREIYNTYKQVQEEEENQSSDGGGSSSSGGVTELINKYPNRKEQINQAAQQGYTASQIEARIKQVE